MRKASGDVKISGVTLAFCQALLLFVLFGTWYVLTSSSNYTANIIIQWGLAGTPADTPVPGDYDGDGKADPAVYNRTTGLWSVLRSSASYGTSFLGDPVFDPILAALDARDAVVFVHPNSHPSSLSLGMNLPTFLVEFPLATTRVAANLIFSGALERFSRIKFILAHFGGTIPYLAWRLSMAPLIDERFKAFTQQRVAELVRLFYFESAQAAGPAVVVALAQAADPQRLLFGTDWPYCPPSVTAAGDATLAASELTSWGALRANTVRLFPRLRGL